jgi:DNA-binding winged helix-turn-helix (wHTH) protein/DNA-binding NarL/FixJ family response regulator
VIYSFADCQLDTQLVELRRNGKPVAIEPQVYKLLQLLLESHQQVLTKDDILSSIWRNRVVSESSLSSCIKAARQAIGDNGEEQALIKTVRGHGFRFVGQLSFDNEQDKIGNVSPATMTIPAPPITAPRKALPGRAKELKQLTEKLGKALYGQSQLMLLAGSAGIGKTRILEELAACGADNHMSVMWGRCREEAGAPAYWPWRQLLLSHLRQQNLISADEAPELASLIPELFPVPAAQDKSVEQQTSEQKRFKLFHAVANLLSKYSESQPLLLIFDDLHRGDELSLRLLEFVAAELTTRPLCIVGTYRDSDLTEGHRFINTLSEFSRQSNYLSLNISNLDRQAINDFVIQELPSADETLIASIAQRTDGHPLYLTETIRHLQQGGDANALPQSLKAIISQRFMHLPAATVQTLRAAAIIGRRFDLASLAAVLGGDIGKILDQIDPAVTAAQLNSLEQPGTYQFGHTLIRETLYDSLGSNERLHYHCNYAEYLQKHDAELAQIAFHFHQAAPLGMADKATEYSILAAEEANRMLAFEIAVRYFQQALQTATANQKAKVKLNLAQAMLNAGVSIAVIDVFDEAAKLALDYGQYDIFAEAAIGMEDAIWRPGLHSKQAVILLQRALSYQQHLDKQLILRLICALMRAQMICGSPCTDNVLLEQAGRLAEELQDPELLARTALAEIMSSQMQPRTMALLEKRISLALVAAEQAKQSGNAQLYVEITSWLTQDMFVSGNFETMRGLLAMQKLEGLATKQPFFKYYTELWGSLFACAKGDFVMAQKYTETALDLCRWLPGQDGEGIYGLQMFSIKREQGKLLGLAPMIEHFVKTTAEHGHWKPGLALIYTEIGELDKAALLFEQLLKNNMAALPRDAMWLTCVAYLSEVCARLDDKNNAPLLYQAMLSHQGLNILIGSNIATLGAADRYLGLLAATFGNWQQAEQHFQLAVAQNDKHNFVIHAAHSRYDYALMLSRRRDLGDRELAQQLLDEVLITTEETGMAALSKQALALRQRVRSGPSAVSLEQDQLSKRELEVLQLITAGKNNKEIARELFISVNTVAAHIRNILDKTHTTNRTEAAAFAMENRLFEEQNKKPH